MRVCRAPPWSDAGRDDAEAHSLVWVTGTFVSRPSCIGPTADRPIRVSNPWSTPERREASHTLGTRETGVPRVLIILLVAPVWDKAVRTCARAGTALTVGARSVVDDDDGARGTTGDADDTDIARGAATGMARASRSAADADERVLTVGGNTGLSSASRDRLRPAKRLDVCITATISQRNYNMHATRVGPHHCEF
jgi:hypothetical protein